MMQHLILVLKDYDHPYLDRVILDVKAAGIDVIPVKAIPDEMCSEEAYPHVIALDEDRLNEALNELNREHSYILTDCKEGAGLAEDHSIGYVYYDSLHDHKEHGRVGVKPQCVIEGFDEINADFLIKMYQRYHHLPWIILSTERLMLREMTVDDVDRLYEIYGADGMTDYTEPLYEDRQQEIEYTKEYIRNMYEFCGYGLWIVIEKPGDDAAGKPEENITSEGRIVGRVGITGREGYDEAELGYVIEKDRQGRGYAIEACRAVIGYARDVLEMSGLNCFVQRGNEASVKLCKRLGFKYLEDVCLLGTTMMRYHLDII